MGSWSELDAVYPPGALTPAAALVVALGHLSRATGVYADDGPAPWLPAGLGYDPDLLGRAGRYLAQVPLEQFLAEARDLLTPRQRLAVALNLLDRQLAGGDTPALRERAAALVAGLGVDPGDLASHLRTLALLHDRSAFPQ